MHASLPSCTYYHYCVYYLCLPVYLPVTSIFIFLFVFYCYFYSFLSIIFLLLFWEPVYLSSQYLSKLWRKARQQYSFYSSLITPPVLSHFVYPLTHILRYLRLMIRTKGIYEAGIHCILHLSLFYVFAFISLIISPKIHVQNQGNLSKYQYILWSSLIILVLHFFYCFLLFPFHATWVVIKSKDR